MAIHEVQIEDKIYDIEVNLLSILGGAGGFGDMTKSTYDTNDNGKVDVAESLEGSQSTDIINNTSHRNLTNNPHSVMASQLTDLDSEITNNASVLANTSKISYTDASDVALNTTHRSLTNNPHSVTAAEALAVPDGNVVVLTDSGVTTSYKATADTNVDRGVALTNAISAATSGDIVVVGPGVYDCTDLLKDGVNYYFYNGAIVDYTGTGPGAAIFYDHATTTSVSIDGFGQFIHRGLNSISNQHQVCNFTGPNTSGTIRCKSMDSQKSVAIRNAQTGNATMVVYADDVRSSDGVFDNISAQYPNGCKLDLFVRYMEHYGGSSFVIEMDGGQTHVHGGTLVGNGGEIVIIATGGNKAILENCKVISTSTDAPISGSSDPTDLILNNVEVDATLNVVGAATMSNCFTTDGGVFNTDVNSVFLDASTMLNTIKSVDGTGSGLDADLLDGAHRTDLMEWFDYDPNEVQADVFDMDNMQDGFTGKVFTNTERTKLSGISGTNTGDITLTTSGTSGAATLVGQALNIPNYVAGGGDVSKVGTPVNEQMAMWTGDGTLQGLSDITYDGSVLNLATGTLNGIAIGAAYPSWMGNNGIYLTGTLKANGYLLDHGSTIRWGDSHTFMKGYASPTGSDYKIEFTTNMLLGMTLDNAQNLDVVGNITVGGTVDGVDIATDVAANTAKVGVTTQISNVVEDTTPQLGGDLDLNGKAIIGVFSAESGVSFIAGEIGYISSSGAVAKTDASAEATTKGMLLMAAETISSGASGKWIINGILQTTGLTAGDTLYASTTTGAYTNTPPNITGEIVRIIGYSLDSTKLYFTPDKSYIEVA